MAQPSYHDNPRYDVLSIIPAGRFESILEVGGGNFPTLRVLESSHGASVWGVDIRRPDVVLDNFVLGSITDPDVVAKLPGEFDLIVANDVIEHIENTEAFFEVLFRMLGTGGMLVLSVPNVRQVRAAYHIFARGTFPRDEAGLFDRTHLRWFCKSDVVLVAEQAGFTLDYWQGSGRLVPNILKHSIFAEFLALQNLFIFRK
ncbi:class I SAM-dependent methyltransferase [uncultured Parasphingorhabdus sp.]|mgnify:CR=1 FL=1|uniref:class I SAM-dependent methyltransferase n=1 Tax=uncultured Parasphingorhabdus sp. TaxID=2709694 RepID=UPI0030DDA396|tara:strand:- start:134669 stop:135271 length:603 start_codon:yes stop_codon:yes gene_type:complete